MIEGKIVVGVLSLHEAK